MNGKSITRNIAVTVVLVAIAYIVGYFLLMRTNAPAIGENGKPVFSSGFIFASPQRIQGDLSIYGPSVTWANQFFLPIDKLWRHARGYTPSRWDETEELRRWRANHTSDGIRQPADGSPKPSM